MPGRELDREVLAQLAHAGSDLTKPAHTIHFLYFPTMVGAKSAAAELQKAGYENVRTHRSPPTSLWNRLFGPRTYTCIAEARAIPSESNVFATSDRMEELAAKFGGDYDGWEASV